MQELSLSLSLSLSPLLLPLLSSSYSSSSFPSPFPPFHVFPPLNFLFLNFTYGYVLFTSNVVLLFAQTFLVIYTEVQECKYNSVLNFTPDMLPLWHHCISSVSSSPRDESPAFLSNMSVQCMNLTLHGTCILTS